MKVKNQIPELLVMLMAGCSDRAEENQKRHMEEFRNEKQTSPEAKLLPKLALYVHDILPDTAAIAAERKSRLKAISAFIHTQIASGRDANLIFICTHNSRRSHFAQIWAAVAAHYFSVDRVNTYSGGTEATAFNPGAVAALARAGFRIENPGGENPHYFVHFAENAVPAEAFSKTYDDPINPQQDFAAVMTCSDADENCPFIPGASKRFAIPYTDPKISDGTPEESATYDERCRQIATEMFYLFSRIHPSR